MGWVGWVGVGVFCLLAIAAWRMDVRYEIMAWITGAFGADAMYKFVGWVSQVAYASFSPTVSILTWLAVLPAIHLSGKRWSGIVAGLIGIFVTTLPLWYVMGGAALSGMVSGSLLSLPAIVIEQAVTAALALAVLVAYSRSKVVAAGCILAMIVSIVRTPLNEIWYWWIVNGIALSLSWALWHVALLVPLYVWAIRERRRGRPAWMCAGCGYDLRGLHGHTCPECGHVRPNGLVVSVRRLCLGSRAHARGLHRIPA